MNVFEIGAGHGKQVDLPGSGGFQGLRRCARSGAGGQDIVDQKNGVAAQPRGAQANKGIANIALALTDVEAGL
jgi:hypothetical protein